MMTGPARLLAVLAVLLGALGAVFAQDAASPADTVSKARLLTLDGPVTPASASYLEREIAAASGEGDAFVVLTIDTPGGLVDSMKTIVKSVLASDVPVIAYVYPQGARSASAGLYIMYASHVAAMAPSTNTGSATPIEIGAPSGEGGGEGGGEGEEKAGEDTSNAASMRGKVIEDSVAYIRSLADERGRNADWAEKAVRPPSASVTAREALELGVIEIVASDMEDLLAQLDGRTVTTAAGPVTIETEGVELTPVEPTLIERVLGFFADPNVAAILLTLGTTGLIVELWNPGSIFPGVFGAICLALAFYSFQVLPFEGLYLALLGLGVVLLAVEAFTPTFGLAGLAGLVLIGTGLYFVFPGEFRVALWLIAGLLAMAALLLGLILVAIVRSRSHGPLTGGEAIAQSEARVEEWEGDSGWVILDGERWKARSRARFRPGERVEVMRTDGLVLVVRPHQTRSKPAGTPARPSPTQPR